MQQEEEEEKEEKPPLRKEKDIKSRFDMNIPVHDKMMELYFKSDEYIEEAS